MSLDPTTIRSRLLPVAIESSPHLTAIRTSLHGMPYGAGILKYFQAWLIDNTELQPAVFRHTNCTAWIGFYAAPLPQLLQITRVGFTEEIPNYSLNVPGGRLIAVNNDVGHCLRNIHITEPLCVLVCELRAVVTESCSPRELRHVDTHKWFETHNDGIKGIIWDEPSKGTMYAVPHWTQIQPIYLVQITKQRKDNLWREVLRIPSPLKSIKFKPYPPRERNTVAVVDMNADFVCIWDKKPMYNIHVLAMPRTHSPSPEGHPTPTLITRLEEYSAYIAQQFRRVTGIREFTVGFHKDPSQEHLHCHIFTPDYPAKHIPAKTFKKFHPPFFLTPSQLLSLLAVHYIPQHAVVLPDGPVRSVVHAEHITSH
jgi:diadenosine tetraphosphate (Ap4A) HIT family hydrolase